MRGHMRIFNPNVLPPGKKKFSPLKPRFVGRKKRDRDIEAMIEVSACLGIDRPNYRNVAQAILRRDGKSATDLSQIGAISVIHDWRAKNPTIPLNVNDPSFYQSQAWREMRYRVLDFYGAKCHVCGATRHTGAVIQVDHIKPKSKYPHLALRFDNLVPTCRDCNLGKSNYGTRDWR